MIHKAQISCSVGQATINMNKTYITKLSLVKLFVHVPRSMRLTNLYIPVHRIITSKWWAKKTCFTMNTRSSHKGTQMFPFPSHVCLFIFYKTTKFRKNKKKIILILEPTTYCCIIVRHLKTIKHKKYKKTKVLVQPLIGHSKNFYTLGWNKLEENSTKHILQTHAPQQIFDFTVHISKKALRS